jgi:predicted ATPase
MRRRGSRIFRSGWAPASRRFAPPPRELAAALAALSREAPLVLVVEELQWADVATLQALTHLAASPLESNLLVVATFGDGEWIAGRRARQRVLSATARTSTIRLPPLTAGQTLAYVDATFGPSTLPDVAAALYQATAGHPFLMRTACESLISRGFLVGGHEGWRRAASLDAIAGAHPETLAGAVAQQLEHLAPREREALEAAAAVGRSFMASQVAYVLETSLEETRALLAPLARRGQLIVLSHELRSSSAQYRFRHAIYSDAIARRAPMIRQRRFSERIRSLRDRDRHRA